MKNLSLLFIAFLFLHLTTFAQWVKKGDMPTARAFLTSCTLEGKIYVLGGNPSTNTGAAGIKVMEVYDPVSNSWDTSKSDMPTGRVELCACVVNGKIYAIGGGSSHSGPVIGNVEEYDPLTDTWVTKNSLPTPVQAPACGVIDDKIYVAGGTEVGFSPSNKLQVYDPVSDNWDTSLMPMDIAIYTPTGAVINSKFYVIGGLIGSPWAGQRTVQIFDPMTNTWLPGPLLQQGRAGHSTNVLNGMIYAIGGESRNVPLPNANVEECDLNTWIPFDETPTTFNIHTASVFDNLIYIFGGSKIGVGSTSDPTSDVYSYNPLLVNVESENYLISNYFFVTSSLS